MRALRQFWLAAASAGIAAVMFAGCLMGPNYQRPKLSPPPAYRDAPAGTAGDLGNEHWFDVFQDPVLQDLIRSALKQNFDVRIAAARIDQAQQQAGITRAEEFPVGTANVSGVDERNPKIAPIFPSYSAKYAGINLAVMWNLDFWGKYRRATEAARDQLLATQWAQKAVVTSLIAQVAQTYFQLREFDDELAIAKQTLAARQDSLKLMQVLAQNGSASGLDTSQSEELVAQAAEQVPAIESQVTQQENMLATLLGQDPGPMPRGKPLDEQPNPPSVPPGLPSELLERRPDIREAEATLMAANAQIGEARAAMFPNITLTGDAGVESFSLGQLLTSNGKQWNLAGNASQVIFAAGSLKAAVRYTEAQEQQMLLTYEQTIQQALLQVSDALIALTKNHEYRQQQEALTQAAAKAADLSNVLYKNGGASYLQVLTQDAILFDARLNLSQAELNERLALVQLYNALGGGWQ